MKSLLSITLFAGLYFMVPASFGQELKSEGKKVESIKAENSAEKTEVKTIPGEKIKQTNPSRNAKKKTKKREPLITREQMIETKKQESTQKK